MTIGAKNDYMNNTNELLFETCSNELLEILISFGWSKASIELSDNGNSLAANAKGLFTIIASKHISVASCLAWTMADMHDSNKWVIATDLHHYITYYQGEPIAEGVFSCELGTSSPNLLSLMNKKAVISGKALVYIQSILQQPINPLVTKECLIFLNNLRLSLGSELAELRLASKETSVFGPDDLVEINKTAWEISDAIIEYKTFVLIESECLSAIEDPLLLHSISEPLTHELVIKQFIGPIFARHLGFAYELSLSQHLEFTDKPIDDFSYGFINDGFSSKSLQTRFIKNAKKREQGVYYTPNDVVQFMSRETVLPLVEGVVIQVENAALTVSDESLNIVFGALEKLEKITILDPSVGCGEFLVESLRIVSKAYRKITLILEKYNSPEFLSEISPANHRKALRLLKKVENPFIASIEYNIHGIDVDPRARMYCVYNLALRCFYATRMGEKNFVEITNVIEQKVVVANTIAAASPIVSSIKANPSIENSSAVRFPQTGQVRVENLFPRVFKGLSRGFTVIIGNPPYHKLTAHERQEALDNGYKSTAAGDIYSLFIELVIGQLNLKNGTCCMIIPMSFAFSNKLTHLRRLILEKKKVSLSTIHFDNIPDTIFKAGKPENTNSNPANSQRATILNLNFHSSLRKVRSTDLIRWRSSEREDLFNRVNYADVSELCSSTTGVPRIGDQTLADFIRHAYEEGTPLGNLVDEKGPGTVFIPDTARYFLPAVTHTLARSGEMSLPIFDQDTRLIVVAAINSNVFYWYWRAFGDGFHVTKSLVKSFPIPAAWSSSLKKEVIDAVECLLEAEKECTVSKKNASKISVNVNFNKRLDLVKRLDTLYLKGFNIKNLKSKDFSRYKLSSYIEMNNKA